MYVPDTCPSLVPPLEHPVQTHTRQCSSYPTFTTPGNSCCIASTSSSNAGPLANARKAFRLDNDVVRSPPSPLAFNPALSYLLCARLTTSHNYTPYMSIDCRQKKYQTRCAYIISAISLALLLACTFLSVLEGQQRGRVFAQDAKQQLPLVHNSREPSIHLRLGPISFLGNFNHLSSL